MEAALDILPKNIIDYETLRLIEAQAALAYFNAWRVVPLQWKGTDKHPIPSSWNLRAARDSIMAGLNRKAAHPVAALLNYAYVILESQVNIEIIKVGLDPAIGYLHVCTQGRASLVYDLMEPFRPQIDRLILNFILNNTLSPKDFLLSLKGICKIHPFLVRKLTKLVFDERTIQQGIIDIASNRSRDFMS